MKFTINQNILAERISIVQRAITARAIVPELEGVLINAKDGNLILTGTDSEITSIETFTQCNIIEEGSTLVNARLFGDIVRRLPNDIIHIEVKEDRMFIKCLNSNFELMTMNYRDFPALPKIEEDQSFTIEGDVLKNAIKQTAFAVSLDFNRRTLTGVYFEITPEETKFVSLDGYRLSVVTEHINVDKEISAIVPGKSLDEFQRIVPDGEEEVKISIGKNNIKFCLSDTVFYSQLIDGNYFNYQDIIRKDHSTNIILDRYEFQQALERAGLLAKEEKANLIKLEFSDNRCKIESNSDLGNVEEYVEAHIEGVDQVIAFNSRYLLEGIRNMNDKEIQLSLLDDVNPMIITGVDYDNYLYLLLPVRLA